MTPENATPASDTKDTGRSSSAVEGSDPCRGTAGLTPIVGVVSQNLRSRSLDRLSGLAPEYGPDYPPEREPDQADYHKSGEYLKAPHKNLEGYSESGANGTEIHHDTERQAYRGSPNGCTWPE
jgi:hypothetical protein